MLLSNWRVGHNPLLVHLCTRLILSCSPYPKGGIRKDIEVSNRLVDWQAEREYSRSNFISHYPRDDTTKDKWKSDLHKHDDVVFHLAERFATSPDHIDKFLDAGWEVARTKIATKSNIVPEGEVQIEKWSLDLMEQLNIHYKIIIEDILEWSKECRRLWRWKQQDVPNISIR